MKKYIFGTIVALLFVVGGFVSSVSAQATSTDDSTVQALQEQISTLLLQVKALQAQISELTEVQGDLRSDLSEVKQLLSQQLREGIRGEQVTLLQELLAEDPEIYPEALVTGFYGQLTKKAVKKFQKKHNIEQVGEVGPLTRAKINELFSQGKFKKIPKGLAKKLDLNNGDDDNGDDDKDKKEKKEKKKLKKILHGNKLYICHSPNGDFSKQRTISVSIKATNAHIGHGDIIGPCDGDSGDTGDGEGNEGGGDIGDTGDGGEEDTTAPVVSGLGTSGLADTSTSIVWTTDEDSDSKVYYSTSTPVLIEESTLTVQSESLVTSHSLELLSLTASTTYYYVAYSTDSSQNVATSSEQSFTTADEVVLDTIAPVISGLTTSSLAATSTSIVWTTDEGADSKVYYSTSTPLLFTSALLVQDSILGTTHSLGLLSLATSTTYYYVALSTDASQNTTTSSEQSFNTLAE